LSEAAKALRKSAGRWLPSPDRRFILPRNLE
jgi:hypothetical protein